MSELYETQKTIEYSKPISLYIHKNDKITKYKVVKEYTDELGKLRFVYKNNNDEDIKSDIIDDTDIHKIYILNQPIDSIILNEDDILTPAELGIMNGEKIDIKEDDLQKFDNIKGGHSKVTRKTRKHRNKHSNRRGRSRRIRKSIIRR
jgi:hypothetical protein